MDVFAKRLRQMQHERGMTQAEFADFLEIGHGTLCNYIKDRKNPQIDTVAKIAKKLGVTVGWLCGDEAFTEVRTYKALCDAINGIIESDHKLVSMDLDAYRRAIVITIQDDTLYEFYKMIEALKACDIDDEAVKADFVQALKRTKFEGKLLKSNTDEENEGFY